MFCSKCGGPIKDGQKFCMKCGAPVIQGVKQQTIQRKTQPQKSVQKKTKIPGSQKTVVGNGTGEAKKKGKVLPIVLIVVAAVLAVLVVLVALKLFVLDPQQTSKNEDGGWVSVSENSETETETQTESEEMPATQNQESVAVEDTAAEEDDVEDLEDEDYILPQSATRKLTAADLEDIKDNAWMLKLARNEIFARYGREFNDQALQEYFDSKDWYDPIYSPEDFDANVTDIVSDMEMKNAKFIKQYEDKLN